MTSTDYHSYVDAKFLESDYAPGGVIVYYADGDEEIIYANQYVIDLFECDSFDDLMELTNGSFRGFMHSEDVAAVEDSIWGQVEKLGNVDHIYYRIKTKTGRVVNVEDYGKLVKHPGERPLFYVFVVEVARRDSIDWLTGLNSMARFHELAEMGAQVIAQRGERPVAVALDLVGLKAFNAQYGRDEGDKLLCVFADVLRRHFGSEACSRFSEDHYYAFAAESLVQDKLEALFADFKAANNGKVLPVRVGVYACHTGDDIVAVGFDRAKIACDLDRKTWQSHVVWFNDDMRAQEHLRIYVLDQVDRAIEWGWIQPHYQPIVRSSTGYICGEEALARWIDPDFGIIMPAFFIPLLEEAGLQHKLDMHMVDCVIADMKEKNGRGAPIVPVSVNISLRDLGRVDIARELAKRMDAAGLPHDLLRVEFTESASADDSTLLQTQITLLHQSGFEVWMDDFGSGYSSLHTLQDFAFDLIKLDMDLIRDVEGERARDIIAGIIQIASRMGVNTLAEGVESEEQALFLESIGCDMFQGYFYYRPLPLEQVTAVMESADADVHESSAERNYWNAVGMVNLVDPTAHIDNRAVDGTPLSEFPAGVMERRGDTWRVLRANKAYREFLDRGGALSMTLSNLQANVLPHGADEEYVLAAERSISTEMWERVAGRMEYGTGLQFYTRPIASSDEAEAFVLASVPTMLGTALGTYGDVPVAYAVLRAVLDGSGSEVIDAEYVYANSVYCKWCNYDQADLAGSSFLALAGEESSLWFPYCYRAAVLKEEVHDVLFSSEVGHWLSFNMAPSLVENCFVFAFTISDDERREREKMIVGRDTSDLIIDITNVFNSEPSYDTAMNRVLEMISGVVNPDRMLIVERESSFVANVFEWCGEGVEQIASTMHDVDDALFNAWKRLLGDKTAILISDMATFQGIDDGLRRYFLGQEVTRLIAVSLRNGSELIGFLTVDNYVLEEGLDTRRLLETVASFISARIINQRLMEELEQAGMYDGLTGVLNRRGIDSTVDERLSERPGEPFVLALMDVDDFKAVNDQYGHDVGDEALRFLSRVVVDRFSEDAIIGRNGGDEFLVMLFGDEVERADALFEGLSNADLSFECNGKRYDTSLSIGYVEYPKDAESLIKAYEKADAALYAVKLMGKSGFMRYYPELETQYRSLLGFSSRDLAEYIPGGIMVHEAYGDRKVLFANDEMIAMLGCESLPEFMEFTGGTFDGLALPEDLPRVREALARQADAGVTEAKGFADYRIRTKSGEPRAILANSRLADVKDFGKLFYVIFIDRS